MHTYFRLLFSKITFWVISIFIFPFFPLHAQTFSETISASHDTDLNKNSSYNNYGSTADIYVGDNDSWRGIIYFDISSIPANALISDATVTLRKIDGDNQNLSISVYRITNQWEEYEATWRNRNYFDTWNTFGGDYNSTAISTITVGNSNTYYNWDVTSLVQDWVDGIYANEGILFRNSNNSNRIKHFASIDYGYSPYNPQITINYTLPSDSL